MSVRDKLGATVLILAGVAWIVLVTYAMQNNIVWLGVTCFTMLFAAPVVWLLWAIWMEW